MAEMIIETPIDKLIKLVREKEKITISEAAKELGVTQTQVEGWIRILEERDFVKLRYPTIGEPIIILKKIKEEKITRKIERERKRIEEKTEKFEEKIIKTEKKIEITGKEVSKLEKELHKKIEGVEKNLKFLDSLKIKKLEIIKYAKEIEDVTEKVVRSFDDLKSNIEDVDKKINEKIKFLESHEYEIKKLEYLREGIRKDIENLDTEIKLTKLVLKGKKIPTVNPLRRLFGRHEKKTEKIKKRHKKLHRKVSNIKRKVKKKKDKVKKKRNIYRDFW